MADRISSPRAFSFFFFGKTRKTAEVIDSERSRQMERRDKFLSGSSLHYVKLGGYQGGFQLRSLGLEITNLNLKEALSSIFKYQHQAKNLCQFCEFFLLSSSVFFPSGSRVILHFLLPLSPLDRVPSLYFLFFFRSRALGDGEIRLCKFVAALA